MIADSRLIKAVTGRKVLIDSNIIIFLIALVEPYQRLAKLLFRMVEAGDVFALISILSVSEVMQGPIKNNRHTLALELKDYLLNFPNCLCQEITLPVLEKVGSDGSIRWNGLRTIDSLIVASGLANDVDLFVSNDRHFQNALPPKMILTLEP